MVFLHFQIPPTTNQYQIMNIEEVREYTLSLPEVTEDMPFGDDNIVFRINGKIFLCLCLNASEPHFATKLLPERNEELRELYEWVKPAWHWNKKHWSDIYYEHFDSHCVKEWITEAYNIVTGKNKRKSKLPS